LLLINLRREFILAAGVLLPVSFSWRVVVCPGGLVGTTFPKNPVKALWYTFNYILLLTLRTLTSFCNFREVMS